MVRSSKHALKFQTHRKTIVLEEIFCDYKELVTVYISLIKSGKLPLKDNLSSKLLPNSEKINYSAWKQIAYKKASELVRSNIKYISNKTFKRYKKVYKQAIKTKRYKWFVSKKYSELKINFIKRVNINLKNVSIDIDQRLIDCRKGIFFDEFIRVRSPYFANGKKRALTIKLPVKQHKHSLQFKDWERKNTIKIVKDNNGYNLIFCYEKASPEKKNIGKQLGIDIGYKKLLTTSDKEYYGVELLKLYDRISKKKQGSKNFKQLLLERDKLINEACNKLPIKELRELIIEDLKNVKHKSIFSKKINNKLQRWSYSQTISKLDRLCEENGVLLTKVHPAYTSQTCHQCKVVKKENRNGEIYSCSCGLVTDADYNAAVNILHRGIYNSSVSKTNLLTSSEKPIECDCECARNS